MPNKLPALSVYLPENRPVVEGEVQSDEDQHDNHNMDRAHNSFSVRPNCKQFVAAEALASLFIIQK